MKVNRDEQIFEQEVAFKAGVSGISDLPFIRKFYVLKTAAALYKLAQQSLKPYADGQKKLYTTLDAAVNACVASRGDIIYVLPGHTETIAAATEFLMDKAGVSVIGVGSGVLKPVFTYSATGSILTITAANCTIENIRLISDIDNCVTAISIAAGGDGTTLKNIDLVDTAANKEFLIGIAIATTCDDVTIDGIHVDGFAATGASSCIVTAGTAPRLKIINSTIFGTYTGAAIDISAGITLNTLIDNCTIINKETGASISVKGNAATTGVISRCCFGATLNGAAPINTVTAMHCLGNYSSDLPAVSGILASPAACAI